MRFPDWRAFESGDLLPQERQEVESLLMENEDARKDFGAYQEYKAVLRQATVADQAPFERLDAMLARAAGRKKISRTLIPLMAGLAAVLAVGLIGPRVFSERPAIEPVATVPQVQRLQTSDPREAYEWIGKNVAFMIPEYKLTETAKLTGASVGKGWGAYEYELDGKPVKLVVRPSAYEFPVPDKTKIGRTTFYVGDSIGFKCPYCAYEMEGADETTRWKLAKAAATELFGGL